MIIYIHMIIYIYTYDYIYIYTYMSTVDPFRGNMWVNIRHTWIARASGSVLQPAWDRFRSLPVGGAEVHRLQSQGQAKVRVRGHVEARLILTAKKVGRLEKNPWVCPGKWMA